MCVCELQSTAKHVPLCSCGSEVCAAFFSELVLCGAVFAVLSCAWTTSAGLV